MAHAIDHRALLPRFRLITEHCLNIAEKQFHPLKGNKTPARNAALFSHVGGVSNVFRYLLLLSWMMNYRLETTSRHLMQHKYLNYHVCWKKEEIRISSLYSLKALELGHLYIYLYFPFVLIFVFPWLLYLCICIIILRTC